MNKKAFNPAEWLPQPAQDHNLSDDIETVTSLIESATVDITGDYASWRDIGFAIADEKGESGREIFHRISRFYPGYTREETDKQYTACLNHNGSGITIKTFFQAAKAAGIDISCATAHRAHRAYPAQSAQTPLRKMTVCADSQPVQPLMEAPTFSDHIKGHLPEFLETIADMGESTKDADVLIIGAIATLSACIPNIFGIYDGLTVFPNLFFFLTARASSGKGRLGLCRYLVDPIHDHLRQIYDEKMAAYELAMQEFNRASKKGNAVKPEHPPITLLYIPANTSATAIYQILADNGGRGLIFETEGDTLAYSFSSDYGNFSDGFRKAFHHEPISYHRRKDDEHVDLKHPQLSTVLSGTPEQVKTLIKSPENGLFSRFIFYCLESPLVWKDVLGTSNRTSLDVGFQDLGRNYFPFYERLCTMEPKRFSLTTNQAARFNTFFEQAQSESYATFGEDIIATVRRQGLICFRIAMILTALRIMEDGDFYSELMCADEDFETALIMTDAFLHHAAKVFTELFGAEADTPGLTSIQQQFLAALPDEFTRPDYHKTAIFLGINTRTADRYVAKFSLPTGPVERLRQGLYRKKQSS